MTVNRGEEPPPAMSASAELRKLAGLVGVWESTAKYRFTPKGEIFDSKSVDVITWSPNQQYLITDQRGLTPEGWKNQLIITRWNPAKKEYALVLFPPDGEIVQPTMIIEGAIRKTLYYRSFGGRLIRSEITQEDISPTEYKFRCECTDEGASWVYCEGIARKTR